MDRPWGEGAPAPLNRWKFGVQGCCIPWNCELGVVLRGRGVSKFLFHGVSAWGLPEGPPGSHKVHSQEKVAVKVSTLELGWKLLAGVSFLTWARHSRRQAAPRPLGCGCGGRREGLCGLMTSPLFC